MSTELTVYAYTPDLDRLRRFYEAGLGVAPAEHGDWLPFAMAGGGTFALHAMRDQPPEVAQRYILSLRVDDIEVAVERFRSAGATLLRGIADEAFGKRAILQDPDGRHLEIVQEQLT